MHLTTLVHHGEIMPRLPRLKIPKTLDHSDQGFWVFYTQEVAWGKKKLLQALAICTVIVKTLDDLMGLVAEEQKGFGDIFILCGKMVWRLYYTGCSRLLFLAADLNRLSQYLHPHIVRDFVVGCTGMHVQLDVSLPTSLNWTPLCLSLCPLLICFILGSLHSLF